MGPLGGERKEGEGLLEKKKDEITASQEKRRQKKRKKKKTQEGNGASRTKGFPLPSV